MMKKVYIHRVAKQSPYPFAEVEDGLPVHPGELRGRVETLLKAGITFSTQSDIVIAMLGWFVRTLQFSIALVYVDDTQHEYDIDFDINGDLIDIIPECGFESIREAGFHYRFETEP